MKQVAIKLALLHGLFIAAPQVLSQQGQELELLLLEAKVNRLKKGDVIISKDQDNRIWIKAADFPKLSLQPPPDKILEKKIINDMAFLALPSPTLSLAIDLDTLTIEINAPPTWLEYQHIDLSHEKKAPLSPAPFFLAYSNYVFAINQITNQPTQLSSDLLFGISIQEWVIQNKYSFTVDQRFQKTRTSSVIFRDWPEKMSRLSIGDIQPDATNLSRQGAIIGLQWSRQFDLIPGFSKNPNFNFIGEANFPSTLEISVDGQPIQNIKLNPGKFDLRNFSYFLGLRNVQLTLIDNLGRRTQYTQPFYFSDQTLRAGLHSYSYSTGLLRQHDTQMGKIYYQGFAAQAMHQYGFTDYITSGGYAETSPEYHLFGTMLNSTLGSAGTLSTQIAWRKNKETTMFPAPSSGQAWQASYNLSHHRWGLGMSYLQQSREFEPMLFDLTTNSYGPSRSALAFSSSVGWKNKSIGINFLRQQNWSGYQTQQVGLNLYWRLSQQLITQINATQNKNTLEKENKISVQFTYQLSKRDTLNMQIDQQQSLQLQRTPTNESPWGTRVKAQYERQNSTLDIQGIYLHKDIILSGASRTQLTPDGKSNFQNELRAMGSVAYSGGQIWFSKPLGESFALIDVAGLSNVRVYQNNQLLGKTNVHGKLFLGNLAPYIDQQIFIDDRDIPLDIALDSVLKNATPRAGTAALVYFSAKKIFALTGRLNAQWKNETIPVVEASLTISDGSEIIATTSTGPDGDFYLENIEKITAGKSYRFMAITGAYQCSGKLLMPDLKKTLIDLGVITCEQAHAN